MTRERFILIDISGSQSCVALATRNGQFLAKQRARHPEDVSASWIWASLNDRIEQLLKAHAGEATLVSTCGIGFGGPVYLGRPLRSEHVPGWDEIDPCRLLSDKYGWDCRITNDGIAGALGEYHFGAARGGTNAVYLTISTGIGGGIILDGTPYQGSRGFAGHLGHIKVGESNVHCPCGGTGCFEALCSGTSIARRARERAASAPGRARALLEKAGALPRISAKSLLDCARDGDDFCCALWEEIARDFGRALASIYNALDPDLIVLGGGVPRAGDIFFDAVRHETILAVLPQLKDKVRIVPAGLGSDSVLFGALALAMREGQR